MAYSPRNLQLLRDDGRKGTSDSTTSAVTWRPPGYRRAAGSSAASSKEPLSPSERKTSMPTTGDDESYKLLGQITGDGPTEDSLEPTSPKSLLRQKSVKPPQEFCIDRPDVNSAIGGVIILNLLIIGVEADVDFPFQDALEAVFVGFYLVEQIARLSCYGVSLLSPLTRSPKSEEFEVRANGIMNIFDIGLVLLGVGEVVCFVLHESEIRLFRYARLLRVVRVFRLFESLKRFAVALGGMVSKLLWIFGVLALVAYAMALFITEYIRQCEHTLEGAEVYFPDVPTSMFSLFQVTTMDSWPEVAEPLISHSHWWRFFFCTFIAFSAWTMISLLTAVVSDNVMQTAYNEKEKEKEEEENNRKEFVKFLESSFRAADADGNGVLDKEEFADLINDDMVTKKIEELGVLLPLAELAKAFDMLDVDEDGELTIEEFTTGLSAMQQTLGTRQVVALDYGLQRVQVQLAKKMDSLEETFNDKFEKIKETQDTVLSCVEKLNAKVDALMDVQQAQRTPSKVGKVGKVGCLSSGSGLPKAQAAG